MESRFGSQKLHDQIVNQRLFPHLEKILANNKSSEIYKISKEIKFYQGRIVLNPDVLIQNGVKDLVFEVKSSREKGAWNGAIEQFKKCEKFYLESERDFNFYIVRPNPPKLKTTANIEIVTLYSSGKELSIEHLI